MNREGTEVVPKTVTDIRFFLVVVIKIFVGATRTFEVILNPVPVNRPPCTVRPDTGTPIIIVGKVRVFVAI